jgi:two-component system phosphate regulon sensor histidine kinase PhoR
LKVALKAENYMLQADALHLNNVLYNIIENAIKYSKDKPEITISTTNTKGGIIISVEDPGTVLAKKTNTVFLNNFSGQKWGIYTTPRVMAWV